MEKLSIIIPAYNAEKHIENCLDSVLNQVNLESEIIIVNDASTDQTAKIISLYANKHKNIKIINMPVNSGPGICRNEGLKYATEKYIGFIDSDDWVDLHFYSTLLYSLKETDSDLAIAGITDEYNNSISSSLRYSYTDMATIDGKTGLKLMTKSCNLGMFITPIMNNKIYKKSYLTQYNIQCCNNRSWQDDFFSFFAILHAKKICIVPNVYYHYRQNELSITHKATNSKAKIDNCIDVLLKIKKELYTQNIYDIYINDFQSFVERNISSLLVMLRRESSSTLNNDLFYLFEKILHNFDTNKIFSYIDNERIYNFFNL